MEYYYIPNSNVSQEEQDQFNEDGIARRRRPVSEDARQNTAAGSLAAGAAVGDAAKKAIWSDLSNTLASEFNDIRTNPELRSAEMQNMIRTYNNFVEQTGNPVEYFINTPGSDKWAAYTDPKTKEDYVFWDSTAPHPAVMAHELGHIHMNHANPILDPLAGLQQSGLGRFSGENAAAIGASGALLGAIAGRHRAGNLRGQLIGTGIGGALGTVGGSGNFAYELGGASGRALDYLPEEVDKVDAAGDLLRAGMTYAMGGPATAAVSALGAGALITAATSPKVRRFAGELFKPRG